MNYGYDDFNQYNVLKVPRLLVVINVYQLKQLAFFLLPMISSLSYLKTFKYHNFHIALMAVSLPAIFVLISMLRRGPVANHFLLMHIWKYGKILLLSNLVLEVLILSVFLYLGTKKLDGITLMFLYIDVALMIYLLRSTRIKDVFAEYFYQSKKSEKTLSSA